MNSNAQQINRINLDAALAEPAGNPGKPRFREDALLLLELFSFPLTLPVVYFLSGNLHLSMSVCAMAYAISAFGAARVRTARRRLMLLAVAAIILGPSSAARDDASCGQVRRLDHYHRAIARMQTWVAPSMLVFVSLCYAYAFAGSNEAVKLFLLDTVGFALMAVLASVLSVFRS